ncbi:YqzE family protein [Bacillus sp. FJAT-45037]|uniref:YqzE family protein n=1 Tax=Bacillus sp. FJAT-45037 TaxID=2011007 RepID=UPI000C250D3B|nr:YqzE family protein [Bacillus sp. FJAT-45037]
MSLNDYVKFVTQQLVLRLDQPKEARKAEREARKADKLPLVYRTFGIVPLAIKLFLDKRSTKNKGER